MENFLVTCFVKLFLKQTASNTIEYLVFLSSIMIGQYLFLVMVLGFLLVFMFTKLISKMRCH